MSEQTRTIGVVGAGSFGSTIANIVAKKVDQVLVYVRSEKRLENFNVKKENNGFKVHSNVLATQSIEEITDKCRLLIFLIPSKNFRTVARQFSPNLKPYHLIIHGTKGLDIKLPEGVADLNELERIDQNHMFTMSEVIVQETLVRRIGCLSGPNLSVEMQMDQPTGAIIATRYQEVFDAGFEALNTNSYKIFSSKDRIGAEYAGVLKNIYAIASGILHGLGYEINTRSLMVTKAMHEMLYLGNSLGADQSAFFGIAGIGDLIATCSSTLSRNFTVGHEIAKGRKVDDIVNSMNEVAEGIRTIQIFNAYCRQKRIIAPMTNTLYKVLFRGKPPQEALEQLMNLPIEADVDFL